MIAILKKPQSIKDWNELAASTLNAAPSDNYERADSFSPTRKMPPCEPKMIQK